MAAMEGVRIHVDEYSCSLCEYRAGVSSKCCCPDDPAQLLLVDEDHFRRRISLKNDQKLCSMHLKKLKRGLLFGRADWYECCAPFHIKSPQTSRLRPVPHSWKSYFESTPARNNRYRPQQRICWGCYMLAMDVISSGLDDTIDEDYEEYQSASFDLGYMSPRRWASNLSLQTPSSPLGSQAGSTWSLAHPSSHSSVTTPPSTRKMDDANNSIDALRKRARMSGGRFLLPSKSLDCLSPQDRSLFGPKQASNATDLLAETQRNLIDELDAPSVGDSDGIVKSLEIKEDPTTSSDIEEPTAFTSGDFLSIPQFTTPPEEDQSSTEAILNNLDREREDSTGTGQQNEIPQTQSTVSTFNSSNNNSLALTAQDQTGMLHATPSNYATISYISKYIKFVYADLRPENKEESSESEDSTLSDNEEAEQTGLGFLKPKLYCEKEFNTIQNRVYHIDRNPEETRKVTEEVVTDRPHRTFSGVFDSAIGISTTSDIPNRKTESPENLGHDESITLHSPHANSNLTSENVVQSCSNKEERSSTSDVKTDEGWEGEVPRNNNNSEGEITGSAYVESFIPRKLCEGSHKNDETRETADWSFSTTFVRHDGQPDDGCKIDKIGIAEGRFDPIICDSGSEVTTSDEEASNGDRNTTDKEAESIDKSSDSNAMSQDTAPIKINDGGDSKNSRTDDTEKVVLDEIASSLYQEQVHEARNSFEGELNLPKKVTTYGPYKTPTPTLATANESAGIDSQYGVEISHNTSDNTNEKTKFVEEQEAALKQGVENALFEQEKRSQEPVKEPVIEPTRVDRAKHVEIRNILEGGSEGCQEPELLAGKIRETEKSVTQEANSDENDRTVGIDGQDVVADDDRQCGTGFGVSGPPQESSSPCVTKEPSGVLTSLSQWNSASKSNGAEDADGESSDYQTRPDSQECLAENIGEQQDFITKTNLYTKLHGSKAEVEEIRKCSVDDGEKFDETAKADGEFNPGAVTNEIPALRSGNHSDDGERLPFLRRRNQNRSGSPFPQPNDHTDFCAVDDSHPEITSDQLDTPLLNRSSLRRDKRRKLGVTFAIDPRTNTVLTKILQSEEEKKNESSEEEHIDSSDVARAYLGSGEDGESENKESQKGSKKVGYKEDEASFSSEDDDVSDVLSDVLFNVFTLKIISEFIQSFNTGSSVQILVVALVTVIVILLILLGIFVFVF